MAWSFDVAAWEEGRKGVAYNGIGQIIDEKGKGDEAWL